jgi:large subunit ribosomal protein L29
MKAAEYVKDLRSKNTQELNDELLALRKEQFNLRMQAATGQMNKSHLIGEVRKKIARVKTVMQSQVKAS